MYKHNCFVQVLYGNKYISRDLVQEEWMYVKNVIDFKKND